MIVGAEPAAGLRTEAGLWKSGLTSLPCGPIFRSAMGRKDILEIKDPAAVEKLVNLDSKPYDINLMVMPGDKLIKVRLNARTVVHLKDMKTFASWKERYPQAEVIN